MKNDKWASEILRDYKRNNKRMFIIILVVLAMWFATIGYLVYVLNDIGTIETSTQEIEDVETIENTDIVNGDMYGENKTNKN